MGSGRPGECGAAALPRVEVALRDVTGCATAPSSVERLARVPRRSTSSAMTESVLVCAPQPSCFPLSEAGFWILGMASNVLCQRSERYKGLQSNKILPMSQLQGLDLTVAESSATKLVSVNIWSIPPSLPQWFRLFIAIELQEEKRNCLVANTDIRVSSP